MPGIVGYIAGIKSPVYVGFTFLTSLVGESDFLDSYIISGSGQNE